VATIIRSISLGDRLATLSAWSAASLGLTRLFRAPVAPDGGPGDFAALLVAALARRGTWIGLAFAATAGAGFEALGGFAGPLLTDAAGGRTDVAGRFFLVTAALATGLGGLAGGWCADRAGARRATAAWGLALGLAVLASAWLVGRGVAPGALSWSLGLTYVGVGGFTAASYALFMQLTEPGLAATQFSAYMGATNLCESWSVAAAGRLVPGWGYGRSFAALEAVALVALCLLPLARRSPPERTGRSHRETGAQ